MYDTLLMGSLLVYMCACVVRIDRCCCTRHIYSYLYLPHNCRVPGSVPAAAPQLNVKTLPTAVVLSESLARWREASMVMESVCIHYILIRCPGGYPVMGEERIDRIGSRLFMDRNDE